MFVVAVAAVLALVALDLRDLLNRPRLPRTSSPLDVLRTSSPVERPRALLE
jgi:hypothetical protein